jgi:hypothetical protein
MRKFGYILILTLALCLNSMAALAGGIQVNLPLETAMIKGGKTLTFDVGIGSGAFRHPADPEGVVYFITDRGPNIDCKVDKKVLGRDICKKGKVFPSPWFVPSIYRIRFDFKAGSYRIEQIITLKKTKGMQINGLPNPFTVTDTEKSYSIDSEVIPFDPAGLDAEGIVKLNDGTFWICDEYAPSLLHVTADGRIIKRLVPKGVAADLKGAGYPVMEVFPAIFMKRKLNRGMESVGVSPDQKCLYTIMQSPLANPDSAAYKASRNVRVLKIDMATLKLLGEYVYVIDTPDAFGKDRGKKQNAVKVSEMRALGDDKLLILERITKTTKLYVADLKTGGDILGGKWDDLKTSPTLAQTKDLAGAGIKSVAKRLVWDSDSVPGMPTKIEGIGLCQDGTMITVNDNDFAITGGKTTVHKLPIKLD